MIIGATIMAAGHFMMAFEPLFYVALATIALGNGLFLPSLPSQINDLYGADDPRRGWAYNVYYVGVNVGGFLAPLICGTLGEIYGWHYGFAAAGVGMLAGLVIYLAGSATCRPHGHRATIRTGEALVAARRPRHLPPAARRSDSRSPSSAAPMNRSATRSRCGSRGVEPPRRKLRNPDDLVPVAEPAAGHRPHAHPAHPLEAKAEPGASIRRFRRWRSAR